MRSRKVGGAKTKVKGKKNLTKQAEIAALAKAWSLFYAGTYPAAYKQVQPLLKSPRKALQVEAAHLQARILWAMQTHSCRQRAGKIWAALRRAS